MLELALSGFFSQGAALVPPLLATIASYRLASVWADASANNGCGRCEQC